MATDNTIVNHLSKDELFEILNEIDAERQHNQIDDHPNERVADQGRSIQDDWFYKK